MSTKIQGNLFEKHFPVTQRGTAIFVSVRKKYHQTNENQLLYPAALHTTVGTSLPQLTGRLKQKETVRDKNLAAQVY